MACAQANLSLSASRQKSFKMFISCRKDAPARPPLPAAPSSSPWEETWKQKHVETVQFEQYSLCPRNDKHIRASPKAVLVSDAGLNSREKQPASQCQTECGEGTESRWRETVRLSYLISSTWGMRSLCVILQLGGRGKWSHRGPCHQHFTVEPTQSCIKATYQNNDQAFI